VGVKPRLQNDLEQWEPVISSLVAADCGDTVADQALDLVLESLGRHADWQELVAVLRRIRAGERDPSLIADLDPIDMAIGRRALAALTGTEHVDTQAWRVGVASGAERELDRQLAALAEATVAAAQGDLNATNALQPLLQALAAHPTWAPLAAAVRRILAGDRDPALLAELDNRAAATAVRLILNQLSGVTGSRS
jgi:nitroreductase